MKTRLNTEEIARYERHLILPEVGAEGQARLKSASVAVVGAGGLGSPVALYLAAAGVGRLGLMDGDTVDLGNLQRQILHGTPDIGMGKTISASETVKRLNPNTVVETFQARLTPANAADALASFDIVVGCVDSIEARYMINQACLDLGKVDVYGAVAGFDGQASVFSAKGGPCYRCLFREPPPAEWTPGLAEKAIIATLPGVIGCIQANETLKLILGVGKSLTGRLLLFDGLSGEFREKSIRPDPECPACGRFAARSE